MSLYTTQVISIDTEATAIDRRDEILSSGEAALLDQLSGEKRKRSFIAGRLAAKNAFRLLFEKAGLEGLPSADLSILRNSDGTLYVLTAGMRRPDLYVSISHGGDFAFAGVSKNQRIGVDVEPEGSKCSMLKDSFATSKEVEILLGAKDARSREFEFVRLFSAKEAAAKCFGTHMYFAFHYYVLTAATKDALHFRDSSKNDYPFLVDTVGDFGHVFSKSATLIK